METDPLEILKHFSHYGVGWTDLRDSENQLLVRYRRNNEGDWVTFWEVDGSGGGEPFWEIIQNDKDGFVVRDKQSKMSHSRNAKVRKIESGNNLDDDGEIIDIPSNEPTNSKALNVGSANIEPFIEINENKSYESEGSFPRPTNSIDVEADGVKINNNNEACYDLITYVEIYMQPLTKSCFDDLVERAKDKQKFPYFVHVKYLCRQQHDHLKLLIRNANQEPSLQLKFSEFTDEDWRIVNRQIASELGEPDNLVLRQFTDFDPSVGNYGDHRVRCFVSYQRADYDNYNIYEGFWEHGDHESHAIMNALNYDYMGLDEAKTMSISIYMNVAPCLDCVEHIRGIVLNRSGICISVYYSSDYDESTMCKIELQDVFGEIEADYLIKMSVTPFSCRTGSHFWRFFNRALCHRIEKERRNRSTREPMLRKKY